MGIVKAQMEKMQMHNGNCKSANGKNANAQRATTLMSQLNCSHSNHWTMNIQISAYSNIHIVVILKQKKRGAF